MPSSIKVAGVYATAYSQGNSTRTAQHGLNKYDDRGARNGDQGATSTKGFKDVLKEQMRKGVPRP